VTGGDLTLVVDPFGCLRIVGDFVKNRIVQVCSALTQHILREPLRAVNYKQQL
jgi:hypothetical protein